MSEQTRTSLGDIAARISEWHSWLRGAGSDDQGGKARKRNTAALADLRRCSDTRDVMLTWPFGRLVRMAFPEVAERSVRDAVSAADIAALARTALLMSRASRVTTGPKGRVPRLMAEIPEGSRIPAVGRGRANILLSSPDPDEACRSLLSLMPLLGGGEPALDPGDLYRAMRWWDGTKTDWAMNYYAALPPEEKAAAA